MYGRTQSHLNQNQKIVDSQPESSTKFRKPCQPIKIEYRNAEKTL